MNWSPIDTIALFFFLFCGLMVWQFRIPIVTIGGVFIYGLALVTGRVGRGLWKSKAIFVKTKKPTLPDRPIIPVSKTPKSIAAYSQHFGLSGTMAITGFGPRGRAIKTDWGKQHTLISGATDGGKTWMLHSLLLQWYSQGEFFNRRNMVYLLDLKGNEADLLGKWSSVVDRFGYGEDADDFLAEVEAFIRNKPDKRVIVIIDEVPNLTRFSKSKGGMEKLEKLASQLRTSGTIIATAQLARHDVLSTLARYNFSRRLCFRVSELSHARMAMATTSIKEGDLPKAAGEFLYAEYSDRPTVVRAPNIENLAGLIDFTIERYQRSVSINDIRLRLLCHVASELEAGGRIMGIRTVGEFEHWKHKDIMYAYRNYAAAGAFNLVGTQYVLAVPFAEAFSLVKARIDRKEWENEPEKASEIAQANPIRW